MTCHETLETLCRSASASSKFLDGRIKGTFVSDYVFNLNQKTLSPSEIKVVEKGLEFSPTPSSVNEVDLGRDISDFSRRIRCKCFFKNESQEILVQHPSLRVSPLGILQKEHLH